MLTFFSRISSCIKTSVTSEFTAFYISQHRSFIASVLQTPLQAWIKLWPFCVLRRYSPKVPVQRQLCVRGCGLVWWLSRICCTSCSTENPELLFPLLHVHLMPWTVKRTVKLPIRNFKNTPETIKSHFKRTAETDSCYFLSELKETYRKQQ